MSSVWRSPDNGSNRPERSSPAASSSRIIPRKREVPPGVDAVAARAHSVTRRLAHEPLGWRPTTLLLTIRRYQCTSCGHVWRQDTSRAAEPRTKPSRRALRWALDGLVVQHLTVARIAQALAVSPNTANGAVPAEGRRVLIDDPRRFDGVAVIGVDDPRALRSLRGPIRLAPHPPR